MSIVIKFDLEHIVDDEGPNNDDQFPRIIMGWKYTQPRPWRRFEGPNIYRWKRMAHDRMDNEEIQVFCGHLNISSYKGCWRGQST